MRLHHAGMRCRLGVVVDLAQVVWHYCAGAACMLNLKNCIRLVNFFGDSFFNLAARALRFSNKLRWKKLFF
jgi:hypothetical protein